MKGNLSKGITVPKGMKNHLNFETGNIFLGTFVPKLKVPFGNKLFHLPNERKKLRTPGLKENPLRGTGLEKKK